MDRAWKTMPCLCYKTLKLNDGDIKQRKGAVLPANRSGD